MPSRKKYNRKKLDETPLDLNENCRVSLQTKNIGKKNQILLGSVSMVCNQPLLFGSQHESYTDPVGLYGECRVQEGSIPTRQYGMREIPIKFKEGKVLLSNLAGLRFRSAMNKIPKKNFEEIVKEKIGGKKVDIEFDCGCIVDEKNIKKEAEHKYVPMVYSESGMYFKEKNPYKQIYPLSWIEPYVEVNDRIFDHKQKWMSLSEYREMKSILNRDEEDKFTIGKKMGLGCYPIDTDHPITSPNAYVDNNIKSNGPMFFIKNGKVVDSKGNVVGINELKEHDLVCRIKSKVNPIGNETGGEIAIETAKNLFGGYDLHFAIKNYYDKNDLDKKTIRQGYQCFVRGKDGYKIKIVSAEF